jgi:hypothetical protein
MEGRISLTPYSTLILVVAAVNIYTAATTNIRVTAQNKKSTKFDNMWLCRSTEHVKNESEQLL